MTTAFRKLDSCGVLKYPARDGVFLNPRQHPDFLRIQRFMLRKVDKSRAKPLKHESATTMSLREQRFYCLIHT